MILINLYLAFITTGILLSVILKVIRKDDLADLFLMLGAVFGLTTMLVDILIN